MNPYKLKPDYAFWSRSVARISPECVDPIVSSPFTIGPLDKVATAGSYFAQHIAKTLVKRGFNYLVTGTIGDGPRFIMEFLTNLKKRGPLLFQDSRHYGHG